MSRRFLEAVAPDLGGFIAAGLVFGSAFAIWVATGHLNGAPPPDTEAQVAGGEGDAGAPGAGSPGSPGSSGDGPEGKTETTAADAGARLTGTGVVGPVTASSGLGGKTYNVILISVDTLRADLGFMGYPRPVSPNIDALAGKSVVFERAYSMASFTPKCLGPLMIGRYSSETYRDYEHYTKFFPENVFLAERLHNQGNRTFAAMCHRYFGWKKGLDQGFDIWDISAIPPNSPDNDPTPTAEKLTDTAIGLLGSPRAADLPTRGGKPATTGGRANGHFFAWFHYLDPHLPYVAHDGMPAFANMSNPGIPAQRAPYDGEVWYTDKHLGRLLAYIAQQPWASETAIVFTADHGEAFGEHGHWGHGRELWEPLVRVPLMVSIPGVAPRRIQTRRSHVDVVPTILELMGITPDDPLLVHGHSLLKDISTPGALEEREVYIDMPDGPYNDMRRAVITGPSPGLKLIEMQGGRSELYDLTADPKETKNIASDSSRMKEGKDAMAKMRATVKEIPPQR